MSLRVISAGAACGHNLYRFFFNDTATTEIYTLSLHDALPISDSPLVSHGPAATEVGGVPPVTNKFHRGALAALEIGRAHV
mgnify:CR=1 FL=1